MKKVFFASLFVFVTAISYAQTMQASLGPGSTPNRVKIYVRPSATITGAIISTLQFNIGISTTVSPKPNVNIVSVTTASAPIGTWQVDQITEGGYYNYNLVTSAGSIQLNTVANTELEIMEVEFSGGPLSPNNVSLVTLPDGGSNANTLFLSTGALRSIGSNLYFARTGVVVNNQVSYDENLVNPGVAPSTATLGGIILPVNWLGFTAVRQGSDVVLNWDVANEQNTDRYGLEVSTNGVDFVSVVTKQRTAGTGTKTYSYLDKQVSRYGGKVLHYRVKQYDTDGKFTYSPTRMVRLDVKGDISLFPNPAADGFTLNIPYLNPNQDKIQLQLVNAIGQIVDRRDITRQAATSYYFNLTSSLITSGDYLLKIYEDGQLTETKRVLIKK